MGLAVSENSTAPQKQEAGKHRDGAPKVKTNPFQYFRQALFVVTRSWGTLYRARWGMDCGNCGNPLPDEKRECQTCGADNGFPNVRLASRPEETKALAERYDAARQSAKARNFEPVLHDFEATVLTSCTVIARSYGFIDDILGDGNKVWTSWARQMAGGARVADDNEFDRARASFEAIVFPNFHDDILFGCLSLDGRGISAYGNCAVVLKTKFISERTTVFEENPILLCRRLGIVVGDPIPPGYRAPWETRNLLAAAKLFPQFSSKTQPSEYADILLKNGTNTADADYIEAHIFGAINRYTIERVVVLRPKTAHDRVLVKSIERKLSQLGASLEVI
jgi:hypothetical protein